mmetsp:Transcript_14293/g.42554  ORF Transcript_14293/g.42554 Transcript_14293/m.42554 type:complete len:204 (+) Transcript_14293:222-833(+)
MLRISAGMYAGTSGARLWTSISRVRSANVVISAYGRGPPWISTKMQPIAQTSIFSVIFVLLSNSSGAMYLGEPPLFFFVMWVRSMGSVRPKSQIFMFRLRSKTMFSDLRSRCTIVGFWECRYITPSATCRHMLVECSRGSCSFLTWRRWCSEPPGMYSVTRHKWGISRQAPMKRTKRLWRKCLKDSISFAKSSITSSVTVPSQ